MNLIPTYNWLKQLWTVDNVNLSDWIKEGLLPNGHYTKGMSWREVMMYSPKNKRRADEIYIKVKGDMKYLFAMMDDETRFLIAQEVADSKYSHDASSLFRKGREIAGKKPEVMITDGLMSYRNAYLQEYRTMQAPRTTHIRNITLKGEKNNNKMERLNGEIRDREKVVRGLKKAESPLLSGYQIYHNYVRPHMSLNGETPADRAGIKIQGQDKWRTLIENASLG